MPGRALVIALGAALAASIVALVLVLREARRTYAEGLLVRLDPSSEDRFAAANASLLAKRPGVARVVLFGDSRMERWASPPELTGIEFVNRGSGGDTTAQLLHRAERDVLSIGADICVIECGVNDLKAIGVFPERRDEIRDGCLSRIRSLVTLLSERHVRVVLLTVLPSSDVPLTRRALWSDDVDAAISEVNASLRELEAPGSRVIDLDPEFRRGVRLVPDFAEDQLHLNDLGYDALAVLLRPVIDQEREKAAK